MCLLESLARHKAHGTQAVLKSIMEFFYCKVWFWFLLVLVFVGFGVFFQGLRFHISLLQLQGIFSQYFSDVLSQFRKTNLQLIPVKGGVFLEDLQLAPRK